MPTATFQLVIDGLRPAVGVLLAGLVVPVLDSIAAQVGVKPYLSERVLSEILQVFCGWAVPPSGVRLQCFGMDSRQTALLQEARYC